MTSDAAAPLDLDRRRALLDEWVDIRVEIARLEARSSALLGERIREHDLDVSAQPFHRDAIYRSMIAEYSAAGHLSKGSVEFAFADALALTSNLPTVRHSFDEGHLSSAHVREVARAAAIVVEAVRNGWADAAVLGLYENAVLVVAESDTPARTRAHARQVAAALVGETLLERHRRAADERCVTVRSLDDGLALLTAVLPESLAVAIHDRISRMSREVIQTRDAVTGYPPPATDGFDPYDEIRPEHIALDDPWASVIFGDSGTFTTDPLIDSRDPFGADPFGADEPFGAEGLSVSDEGPRNRGANDHTAGDTAAGVPEDSRTIDQVRADLFADLLLAGAPSASFGTGLGAVQARVQVTVAATTLAGLDDKPAELDGHGPLDPDTARAFAGRNNGWSRLFLDPTGMVTETDTYTPTEGMRRFLRARDQHCRFPGCRMPVHRCEIDHNHDHARGGRTRLDNLSHFCIGHHGLKHPNVDPEHRWSARSRPDGAVEWISPLGRAYPDHPARRVMFI